MSEASAALSAATTMCLPVPIFRPANPLTPSRKTISSGTSTVENRKARPRICSRYSRFATSSILRIGLASHGLDEDLFKRGLNQLKAIDGSHARGLVEQLLRIAVRLERDLGVAGVVVGFSNLVALEEVRVAFEFHDHMIALVAAFDLAHFAREHRLAAVDEADGIAELFHLVHAVG